MAELQVVVGKERWVEIKAKARLFRPVNPRRKMAVFNLVAVGGLVGIEVESVQVQSMLAGGLYAAAAAFSFCFKPEDYFQDHRVMAIGSRLENVHLLTYSDKRRVIVNWDLKHIETVSLNALVNMFAGGGAYVACRMREQTATALQQALVSDLGRVGEMRIMPSMFPVECKIYYTDTQRALKPLDMTLSGVCVIGADSSVLAFDAGQRREFQACVVEAQKDVFPNSSDKLASTLTAEALNQLFTRGFVYKMTDKALPCEIDVAGKKVQIGKVVFNKDATIVFKESGPRQGEGLIFELTEDI